MFMMDMTNVVIRVDDLVRFVIPRN